MRPRQGLEFSGFMGCWAIQTIGLKLTHQASRKYGGYSVRILMNQVPALPFIVAGVLLVAGWQNAIYWLVPGILLSIAAGVFNAWVLLIEIQR